MLRTLTLTTAVALGMAAPLAVHAATEIEVTDFAFPFEGPFGSYDQMQLQRGLQIYTEICATCHGLERVAIGTLADAGGPQLPEEQVIQYATDFPINDPDSNPQYYDRDKGDYRTLTPADKFPANHSINAPDLSLMAKARVAWEGPYGTGMNQLFKGPGGAEYIASLMTHYEEAPACAPADFPGYYNKAFPNGGFPEECKDAAGLHTVPGSWIAMPEPLYGDDVTFEPAADSSLEAEAQDVAAFLMWTAEPKMNQRKTAGLTGVIFLTVLSVLLYLTNKRLWAPYKHPAKRED